jgi:glycosyltransferase involved in cell wall biosynthesis
MKLVTTVHGWGAQPTRRTVWYNGVDRFCLRYYDDVICVSEDLWTTCRRRGVLESRCHLVQNAIDTEIFRRASRPTTKQHGPLILGALGRLSSEKGFDLLVRAVVAMNQQGVRCQLRIGGDGTQRDNLESLIRELNCGENVKLLGHIHDVKSFIQGLDVFVLSSVSEGLPNVVLEAMAMEVPVAATRVAGVPQLIRDGENGVLVEPGSVIGLVDGVSRLFADSELRGRVAAAGRDTVVHSHSFDVRMRRIVDIYDQSLGRRPSSQHTRELA